MSWFDFCCLGGKGLLGLHVWSYPSVREVWAGSQGRNLEEGIESEAMEELTVWLPQLALLAFIDNPGPQPRGSITHSALGPSHQPSIKKCSVDTATGKFNESNSLIEVPTTKVSLVCVKLKKPNHHTYWI